MVLGCIMGSAYVSPSIRARKRHNIGSAFVELSLHRREQADTDKLSGLDASTAGLGQRGEFGSVGR